MVSFSTGFVRAAGYADKTRRVLFAVAKGVKTEEIVKAAAEFNQRVFEELQKRGVRKEDVVRIRGDFEIEDGKIKWNWDKLEIEVYYASEKPLLSQALKEFEETRRVLEEYVDELLKLIGQLGENLAKLTEVADKIRREFTNLEKIKLEIKTG